MWEGWHEVGLNSAVGNKKSYFVRALQQQHWFQSHLNTKLPLIVTHVMWMGEGWGGGGEWEEREEKEGGSCLLQRFLSHIRWLLVKVVSGGSILRISGCSFTNIYSLQLQHRRSWVKSVVNRSEIVQPSSNKIVHTLYNIFIAISNY